MFENKKTILFITRSKIKLANVALGKPPTQSILASLDWTPETLPDVLSKLHKEIKGSVRLLLAEDFVYTVNVTVPAGTVSREIVKKIAQELIPENLDETAWDFRVIGSFARVQVVAVSYAMFETLKKSIKKAGLHIEAIEPLSFALARFSKEQDKPVIYVYIDEDEVIVIFAEGGIVMGTKGFTTIDLNAINQFRAFVKERFSLSPKDIIFCGNTSGVDLAKFSSEKFKAQIQNINPIMSLAFKEDIKGKDEQVLNLELMNKVSLLDDRAKKKIEPNTSQHLEGFESQLIGDSEIKPYSRWHSFTRSHLAKLIALLLVLWIGGGVYFYFNIYSKKSDLPLSEAPKTDKPTTENGKLKTDNRISPEATSSASATSSGELDFSKYSIAVLNGSGRAGEAGRLESILKEEGFNVTEVGNADRSDYEQTEIRHKEAVPEEVILELDKSLKSVYSEIVSRKLEEDSVTDIVIIIGEILTP